MKTCPACNAVFEDSDDFCQIDGVPLVSSVAKNPSHEVTTFIPQPGFVSNAPPVGRGNTVDAKWVFLLAGLLIGVIAVGFIAWSSMTGKDEDDQKSSASNTNSGNEETREPEPNRVENEQAFSGSDADRPPPQSINGRYSEGSTRYLTDEDLLGKSSWELRIMRNEIFARHGYIFNKPELRDYFNSVGWYQPRYSDVSNRLSMIERKNAQFLKSSE